nr:hypothetical protein [Tanacetum cinerariifolium]
MAKLAFCDYHNMVAILEKTKHNTDFHQIVDFLEASHIRYALTISPTVYVSHIRQFWSTTRIETTDQETKIITTVDGKLRTISESSLRRHLKLNDEEGISSLHDAELFENLSLMGYNILPNQRFTFQKGQFSHQWKFLIHTIMQCLSPKSTSFNEFSSNTATVVVCLATNRVYNCSKMIFDGMVRNINGKGTKFQMYPRFISKCLKMGQFGKIAHTHTYSVPFHTRKVFTNLRVNSLSFSGQTVPLFTSMIITQGEGSTNPTEPHHTPSPQEHHTPQHDSPPSLHQTNLSEPIPQAPTETLTPRRYTRRAIWIAQSKALSPVADEPASLLRDDRQREAFPTVSSLDAGRTGKTLLRPLPCPMNHHQGFLLLMLMRAPMRIPIIGAKDKGKEKVIKTEVPKKRKLQEQIDAQIMIEGLDRSNEVIAKHLSEYEQAKADLSVGEKIELISELMKYQDHRAKILKYQAQQSKPLLKKEKREFYMSVLRSHTGWKTRHLRGMTLEQIKEKFIPVWKQFEDFVPMSSKEESERVKRQGLKIDQGSSKSMKISEDVSKEELKGMMQLVPLEEVYIEALQEDLHQLWTLVKETFSIKHATRDKEKELWVELKRLFEPDFEDHLWTHHQAFMHDPLDWKLYETCGVHHVSTKDQEVFMLVEKDYPLRKGLATVMISNKLQVEQYSQMTNDLILKNHSIANSPR